MMFCARGRVSRSRRPRVAAQQAQRRTGKTKARLPDVLDLPRLLRGKGRGRLGDSEMGEPSTDAVWARATKRDKELLGDLGANTAYSLFS